MADAQEKDKDVDKEEEDDEEENRQSLLTNLMNRFSNLLHLQRTQEPAKDPVLPSFDLPAAAEFMKKSSNIIVMAGAGISTSAGIPDFRSPGTGLYSQLEKYNLPFPEAIFHLDFFRGNPKPFFLLAKELFPQKFNPTPAHLFLRLLNEKNKLLRVFTQNIDSLERIAGVPDEKLVEAHGTFFTAHCMNCRKEYDIEFIKEIIFKDEIPHCEVCQAVVKPDIVFFGEGLPSRFHECVLTDFSKVDFLIIIGTSLKVAPFNRLVTFVDKDCPRLLINIEPVGNQGNQFETMTGSLLYGSPQNRRDVFHQSSCDDGVKELAKLLGWEDDFNALLQEESKPTEISTVTEAASELLAEQLAKTSLESDPKDKSD